MTVGQSVDPQTRTVPVDFEVTNPLNRVRDGMFVEITIETTGNNTVLSVPKHAVITEQVRRYVYVFEGGLKLIAIVSLLWLVQQIRLQVRIPT